MTVLRHELRANRVSLIIWTAVLCGMTLLVMLMYPSFKDQMGTLSSVMAMLGPFSAAVGLDRLTMDSAAGFYGIETGTMLAVGGAMFAALTGILMLSKEEGGHTAEFLLTQPISRARVVTEKLLALGIILLLFNGVNCAVGLVCFPMIGEPVPFSNFFLFHGLQLFLHLEIGCVCLALSAYASRGQIGLGLGIALLLYFVSLFVNMVDALSFLKYATPFAYADASRIFADGTAEWPLLAIGGAVTVLSVAAAYARYGRKDIAA